MTAGLVGTTDCGAARCALRTASGGGACGRRAWRSEAAVPSWPPRGRLDQAEGWPHCLRMCEGRELPRDSLLFLILIYTASDISCINEISPSLPATTHV